MSVWDEAFDEGHRAARRELAPLVGAINDALLMFKDIERARQLPPEAFAQRQYVAMGQQQLERLLDLSGLRRDAINPFEEQA